MAAAVAQLLICLEDKDCDVRVAAVRGLSKGALRGDPAAVGLLATRAKDEDEDVRESALAGLAELALRRDPVAGPIVVAGVQDVDGYVRQTAARAVGDICCPNDETAIGVLLESLCHDQSEHVREAALDGLENLSVHHRDNADCDTANPVIAATLPLLKDQCPETRNSGLQAFCRVSERGNCEAVEVSLGMLSDSENSVRRTAAGVLAQLANHQDAYVVDMVLGRMRAGCEGEQDKNVRAKLLEVLRELSPSGHESSIEAAVQSLTDVCDDVREAAEELLLSVATPGDSKLVLVILLFLCNNSPDIRVSGLNVLAHVAHGSSETCLDSVCSRLSDDDEFVRFAAVKAVREIAPRGDVRAIDGLLASLRDEDEDVRRGAAIALGRVSHQGNQQVINALRRAFLDDDCDVRVASVRAAGELANCADIEDIEILAKNFEDESECVRDATVHAVVSMAIRSRTNAFERVLSSYFGHVRPGARRSSLMAFATLAKNKELDRWEDALSLLEDCEELVREGAVDVVEEISEHWRTGSTGQAIHHVEEAILKRCRHPVQDVRASALDALRRLAPRIKGRVVEPLCLGLEEKDQSVREAAQRNLSELAPVDERITASLVESCVRRIECTCRARQKVAVDAIRAALPAGSIVVADAARARLLHKSARTRRAALEMLAASVGPLSVSASALEQGDEAIASVVEMSSSSPSELLKHCISAVAAVAECLEDVSEMVRSAAVTALRFVCASARDAAANLERLAAERYRFDETAPTCCEPAMRVQAVCEHALNGVKLRLCNEDPAVRCSAAEAVAAVAATGDNAIVSLLADLAAAPSEDDDVRWSALQSLRLVSSLGNQTALRAAAQCAKDPDEQIRTAAVQVLGAVAERGDATVICILRDALKDSSEFVTRKAGAAMLRLFPEIASKGEDAIEECFRKACQNAPGASLSQAGICPARAG